MKTNKINLGKVSVTIAKEPWDINKDYDRLTIVEVENAYCTYISRKPVPSGTDIENTEYWMMFSKYTKTYNSNEGVFNMSKYLKLKNEEDALVKLNLTQAVTSAPLVIKNAGQIITFLDTENVWQQYQYQSDTIDDWDNLLKWKNLNDSSSTPIEEGAHVYNISEYIPGGAKYGQPLYAGVYTIGGTTTPVTQYRFVFGYDDTLGEVSIENKEDTLVILDYDTYDELVVRSYYLFVGNSTEGYYYQTTIDDDEEIPEWISRAFGSTNDSILVNINKLKEEINRTKISKGGLKTIQGKSIEGTGNIEIDTYINQFASSNNPINWNWGGDGNIASVDIDNVKGVKASYSEEYTTGNVYSILDVTLKAKHHYLFSFYLSGEGECDLSLSNLWDNVYVIEFFNPIIIDGNEYIEHDDWKSHLKFTSVGYHYISFYANTSATEQIDFEFNTNNNIIFYKPLFVACDAKATINWFANNEDIFTTKEQFGIAFKGVTYNSTTKKIEFTCVDNSKKYLDATDFIKDGMVNSVTISEDGTKIIISFNTDAGKEDIIINITDLFDPVVIDTTNNIMKINKNGVTYYTNVSILAKPDTPTISTTSYNVVTGNVTVPISSASGTTVQYSLDDGNTWNTGNSITIASGFSNTTLNTIKRQSVKVKATKNGETSDIGSYTITIYPKVAPVSLSVVRNNNNNNWSTSATITFTASATTNAISMYSIDGGSTWTDFTGTHTETTSTSQSANMYQVKTDLPSVDYVATDVVKSSAITLNAKKFYYGNGDATLSSESDIKSLTGGNSVEKATMAGTYSINKELNKYLWFCGSGTLTKITSGGFEVPVNSVVTIDGYNCYRISGVNAETATDTFVVS